MSLCRIMVFTERKIRGRIRGVAWQDWNDDPRMETVMARLGGSGSFYYPTHRKAWRRAQVLVRRGASQVKIETISGHEVDRIYGRRAT